jgi:aminoglycoside-2''-adenylyltransferase
VLDIHAELRRVTRALDQAEVQYALVGGLAVSVHARPRATDDIDVLIAGGDLARVTRLLASESYQVRAEPMVLARGRLRIQRLLKVEGEDMMLLDLLLADDAELVGMLERRVALGSAGQRMWVAALPDLRTLKRLRGSPQDLADLDALRGEDEE